VEKEQRGRDGLQWPQRDGLKWPHLALVDLLLGFVHLSGTARARPVRQDCSFAEKQESPPCAPAVIQRRRDLIAHETPAFSSTGVRRERKGGI
jgi:hypothetical protein